MRLPVRAPALLLASLLALAPALLPIATSARPAPDDAEACASFAWPLVREQAWFSAPDLPVLASGATLPAEPPAALLTLEAASSAALPLSPSRAPKPDTFAGYVAVSGPFASGEVQVTLSGEGWIDVAETDGALVPPGAHTGRKGCPTLRKSVRFTAGAKPLIVMISNATAAQVRLAVTPAPQP